MIIEEYQRDTVEDLKRGKVFIANDPHYRRERAKPIQVDIPNGKLVVQYLNTGDIKVLDLGSVLRGFDTVEYVWN